MTKESLSYSHLHGKLTRRQLIGGAIVTAGAFALARYGLERTSSSMRDLESIGFEADHGQPKMVDILRPNEWGIKWTPDGHTSVLPGENGIDVFLSGGPHSYLLRGKDLYSLQPHKRDDAGNALPVLEADPAASWGSNYRGLSSVFEGNTPNERLGIFHAETWPDPPTGKNFQASIGIALSNDNGETWQNPIQVIRSRRPKQLGAGVNGAGEPSAVIIDDNIYMLYMDWGSGPDSLHAARVKKDHALDTAAWEKWSGTEWVKGGPEADSTPVVIPPGERKTTQYAALPSLSYNQDLKRHIAVFESNNGFWYTTSVSEKDITKWNEPQQLLQFPQPQQSRSKGATWYSYPTLISPNQKTDKITRNTGVLLCSKGIEGDENGHHMIALPYRMKIK